MPVPASSTVREALAEFYREHGLSPDGGLSDRWVRIRIAGPVSVYFPNFESRRRSVLPHDMHHVAAGYGTTLAGEAEIGGWEIGGGCGAHPAAWILNTGALLYGVPLLPRRVFREFIRGRHTRNLYHAPPDPGIMDRTVGELRRSLLLDQPARPATRRDLIVFGAWAAAVLLADLVLVAAAAGAIAWLARLVSRSG